MNTKQWKHIFSKNLTKKMDEVGIGQRELSRKSGVSETAIFNYLNENREPKFTIIIKLAEALECPVNDLIY